ncbi:MAG: GNAT family N-acetyltransferase [Hyphomicrobiales bacterium]
MPTSVPVMILGRLAVNQAHQGHAIGSGLLVDAMRRTLSVAKEVGVRAMLVHAIDDDAIRFYVQYGFISFPDGGKTLFLPLKTVIAAFPAWQYRTLAPRL